MSEPPGRSAPDISDSTGSSARTALRRVGEYVLVAQLGDDALGSVYRALSSDGRFVRLRVLQSPELSPRAVLAAAECESKRRAANPSGLSSYQGELHVADGTPYLVWPDLNGWTLDFVLARARAGGWGMPIEFALLIVERAAAQLELAAADSAPDSPRPHGALWPGFVSVSPDAEVHVGGFGLAEAMLPALTKPRMWRDVAPYIAPEVRTTGKVHELSDVYSIGVLLIELMTGRRASADSPPQRWRADDDFSQEVSLLLRFALAQSSERFPSVARLHASLKELIQSCPFEASPADLALFLYELLSPESRLVPGSFDGNSTNPVPAEAVAPALGRLTSDAAAPSLPLPSLQALAELPMEERPSLPETIFGVPLPARPISFPRWIVRVAALAAAIAGLVFVNLPIRPAKAPGPTFSPGSLSRAAQIAAPTAAFIAPAIQTLSSSAREGLPRGRSVPAVSRASAPRAPVASVMNPQSEDRAAAETLRLKAALARIESERLDAPVHAADTFQLGRSQEQDGEHLLVRGEYASAREAYAVALGLFEESQALSRQERMRLIQISGEPSGK